MAVRDRHVRLSANRVPINDLRAGIAYEFSGGPVVAKF